VSTDSFP